MDCREDDAWLDAMPNGRRGVTRYKWFVAINMCVTEWLTATEQTGH